MSRNPRAEQDGGGGWWPCDRCSGTDPGLGQNGREMSGSPVLWTAFGYLCGPCRGLKSALKRRKAVTKTGQTAIAKIETLAQCNRDRCDRPLFELGMCAAHHRRYLRGSTQLDAPIRVGGRIPNGSPMSKRTEDRRKQLRTAS